MENIIRYLSELAGDTIESVLTSVYHNWIPLSFGIITAALIKVFVNAEKLKKTILDRPKVSIGTSVFFGAFTPLCACGTMAVVIGLLSTALPWGPVMAFLTSSPLMSPDTFILLAGIVSFRFAFALTVASVILGLGSGVITHVIEKKTSFLDNQLRFLNPKNQESCACQTVTKSVTCECNAAGDLDIQECCAVTVKERSKLEMPIFLTKLRIKEVGKAIVDVGFKQIMVYFCIFAGLGYLIQSFVPTSVIMSLFSSESVFAIPLAAVIGLPLYVSGEGAIPLIESLMNHGAGEGAMMAFMITGPATSAWVIAGISAFMKKKVIGLYLIFVFFGGILLAYGYQLILNML